VPAVSLAIAFAVVGYVATFAALMFPDLLVALVLRLAKWMNIAQIEIPNAVVWMVGLAEPQGWRLFLLSAGAALLVWVAAAGRRESRVAAWALLVLMCADLTVTSAWVNLMQPASDLGKADWIRTVEQHPSDRFYFGGRPRGGLDPTDIDAPGGATLPGAAAAFEVRTLLQAQIVTTSSPWHIRDALTYDLPNLFAVEYEHVVQRFEEATHAERLHFLSVAGVRYCVMPEPPRPWSQPLGEARWFKNMKLYECDPRASRVRVTPPWGVVETNLEKQIDYLFRTDFDARQMVVLSANPPAAVGTTGPPVASPYASLTRDEATYVEVAAGVGAEGGFLVLADTFDEDWHVDVDDRPAPLLRANAVYRGVRLVPGVHVVRFRYQPHKLLMGAMISGVTLVGLVGLALLAPRRQRAISSLQVPLSVASSPSGSEAAR
jgi:hypothetical protein